MKRLVRVWVAFCLISSAFISFVEASPNKLPSENSIKVAHGKVLSNLSIKSTITGIEYPYHVYLPNDYDVNSDKHYPIIYASDAQWVFHFFAKTIDKQKLKIILVGIEEGPKGSARRNIDYKLPGVGQYINFFSKEFMPLVESNYRVEKTNRTIQGTSFGGLFTLAFMLAEDAFNPLFKNILTYDATVQLQGKALLNIAKKRFELNKEMDVNLVITGASKANGKHIKKFVKKLKKIGFEKLNIYSETYNVTHGAITNASFQDSLDIILQGAK